MELLRAAEVGNVHTLRHILQTGADVNYRHPQASARHVSRTEMDPPRKWMAERGETPAGLGCW